MADDGLLREFFGDRVLKGDDDSLKGDCGSWISLTTLFGSMT